MAFDEIEESLDGHTGSGKAGGAVHDLFVDGDDAGQCRSLLRGHNFKVGHPACTDANVFLTQDHSALLHKGRLLNCRVFSISLSMMALARWPVNY
jgi:hypothetical protein